MANWEGKEENKGARNRRMLMRARHKRGIAPGAENPATGASATASAGQGLSAGRYGGAGCGTSQMPTTRGAADSNNRVALLTGRPRQGI